MTVNLKPYPFKLRVFFDKIDFDDIGGQCSQATRSIRIDLKLEDYEEYYIHEAVHAVTFLEQMVETDFDDETRAYWTQFICNKTREYALKMFRIKKRL